MGDTPLKTEFLKKEGGHDFCPLTDMIPPATLDCAELRDMLALQPHQNCVEVQACCLGIQGC